MKFWIVLICGLVLHAQQVTKGGQTEEEDLRVRLGEAGNSTLEFSRALETHLKLYPKSPQLPEIERSIFRSAIELKEPQKLVEYGVRILERDPEDLQALEHTARALLVHDDKASAAKALQYGLQFEKVLRGLEPKKDGAPLKWQQRAELDQGIGRALAFQARASGNLGQPEDALKLAQASFSVNATAEAAREQARWLVRLKRLDEAAAKYADAYSLDATDAERHRDLSLLRENWVAAHKTETGAGDHLLAAHDRAAAWRDARLARLRAIDPNALETEAMNFVLPGVAGIKLPMTQLKGKVVILDFWATWCAPCRVQHPLYEQVKKRFEGRDDVVFINISTDEDQSLVEPFLEKSKWSKRVYFESGLSRLLNVSSIPTTVIFNKRGEVASRMNGFLPDRFVDMLSERIQKILEE